MASWYPLESKYSTEKPRKILSLDGGGIRGVLTLEILKKLENDLKYKLNEGNSFRLGNYFDLIGGTSTGAIIAAGLSIGMSVEELLDFYTKKGKAMFDKNFLLKRWKSFYGSGELLETLKNTFGDDTNLDISNGKFKSLLTVVTMNRSTDSPWPISNNPFAKYNDKNRPDCNLNIKLYQLVRASTAAPVYFPPETLEWDPSDPSKTFSFVDGGVTPYNNPAFLLYRMATQAPYKLDWKTGENNLLIVSIGTGSSTSEGDYKNILHSATQLPGNLMYAMSVDQDINCRTVGKCKFGAPIDKELHDLIPMDEEGNVELENSKSDRHFSYVRYNADLSQKGLIALGLNDIDPEKVQKMDSVEYISELRKVGEAVAREQVDLNHIVPFA
jgi:hypothetical protein